MNMSMSSGQRIIVRCMCGGTRDNHEPGCPQERLNNLVTQQRHIRCPKCGHPAVGVNDDDFYECRDCHTQYTIANMFENAEREFLDDPRASDIRAVQVHPLKGTGKFRLDKLIDEARAELVKASKKKRRH